MPPADDGVRLCAGDCDDEDADRHPGAPELPDCLDTDCDGLGSDDCEVGTSTSMTSSGSSSSGGELPTTGAATSTGQPPADTSTGGEAPGLASESGCQCTTGHDGPAGLLLLACLAPLARRRRR